MINASNTEIPIRFGALICVLLHRRKELKTHLFEGVSELRVAIPKPAII